MYAHWLTFRFTSLNCNVHQCIPMKTSTLNNNNPGCAGLDVTPELVSRYNCISYPRHMQQLVEEREADSQGSTKPHMPQLKA